MSLIGSVSGFAAFGVLVRTYALGLQKRPLFTNPSSHLLAAGVFGSVGYFIYNLQERQAMLIAAKKEVMIKNRAHAEELASQ
ncbi:MAG: hypothetical protein EXX96DRAFT_549300 [Benjaminiella poitrasii]|nr:MAG: hypothetical protein EXX96DRAFT_549300 [Benjaminiella poitrasii]